MRQKALGGQASRLANVPFPVEKMQTMTAATP